MTWIRKNALFSIAIGAIALVGIVLYGASNTDVSQAQLSCDDPFGDTDISFRTEGWTTDFCQYTIDLTEILWGGVPRDGIPPIDNPEFDSIDVADEWLQPQSPVVVIEINDDARAYPLAILTRHEIINDIVGDVPVAVTFCPLCNSAMVFDRRLDDDVLRLGVSGNLRNSDLIMWDDVTESWWQQLTGEGIVGEHAGRQLTILPSLLVGYGDFVMQHPDGLVLSPGGRSYGRNPYVGYDSRDPRDFLFRGELDERLNATERVIAGVIDGQPMAYAFSALEVERVLNDTVGETDLVALWQPGTTSALDAAVIDDSVDVGMAALYERTVDDTVLTFTFVDDEIRDEQTDSLWNVFGTAIDGELTGTQLRPIIAAPHFWFAWAAFHPDAPLYTVDGIIEATE